MLLIAPVFSLLYFKNVCCEKGLLKVPPMFPVYTSHVKLAKIGKCDEKKIPQKNKQQRKWWKGGVYVTDLTAESKGCKSNTVLKIKNK